MNNVKCDYLRYIRLIITKIIRVKNRLSLESSKQSLLGVSIGDAFGESFFGPADIMTSSIQARTVPETSWRFTDDTIMSIAILEELEASGSIDQERLIASFCRNHRLDPNRGYGATLRKLLREIEDGAYWQTASKAAFDGQGSMGNGAAMRVCPIGAFYYNDLRSVKELAIQSAETTHSNSEAIAGAIAIAIGTALTTQMGIRNDYPDPIVFIERIVEQVPDSDTKSKIAKAKSVPYEYNIETVKTILGNGTKMTSQDTVPFAIWCTAYHLVNFEEALWKAVSALGDRDTICAMVGGMTIMSSREENVPIDWINAVEPFDSSPFRNSYQS